jgi:hypothetical protein
MNKKSFNRKKSVNRKNNVLEMEKPTQVNNKKGNLKIALIIVKLTFFMSVLGYCQTYIIAYDPQMHMFDSPLFGVDLNLWIIKNIGNPLMTLSFIGSLIYYFRLKKRNHTLTQAEGE